MKHLRKYNENSDSELKSRSSHTSLICPYCDFEQNEVPENILSEESNFTDNEQGSSEFGQYTCEECNTEFEFVKQIEVVYVTNQK